MIILSNIRAKNSVRDPLGRKSHELVSDVNVKFEEEYVHVLYGDYGSGAWGISWMLSGIGTTQSGSISIDGIPVGYQHLRRIGFTVGYSDKGRYVFREKPVRYYLEKYAPDIHVLIEAFRLTSERLSRPISYYSNERWRASLAIGYAMGKKIFSFPLMDYNLVASHKNLYFEEVLEFMISNKRTIFLPIHYEHQLERIVFSKLSAHMAEYVMNAGHIVSP